MAKEEKGYWFSTENGTHVHAEEGESKAQAMGKKFSNFGKKETKDNKNEAFENINAKRMGVKDKKEDKPKSQNKFDEEINKYSPEMKEQLKGRLLSDIKGFYSGANTEEQMWAKSLDETIGYASAFAKNTNDEKYLKELNDIIKNGENKSKTPSILDDVKYAIDNNLDIGRVITDKIKKNPEQYKEIEIGNKKYVQKGSSYEMYRDDKLISTGTFNSVGADIAETFKEFNSKNIDEYIKNNEWHKSYFGTKNMPF